MVITVLEAEVPPERQEELRRTFEQGDEEPRPDALYESYLVKLRDANACQVVTVWKACRDCWTTVPGATPTTTSPC